VGPNGLYPKLSVSRAARAAVLVAPPAACPNLAIDPPVARPCEGAARW